MTEEELEFLSCEMYKWNKNMNLTKKEYLVYQFNKKYFLVLNKDLIINSLNEAIISKSSTSIYYLVILISIFDVSEEIILDNYNFLVDKNWHVSNFDIADFLQGTKSPSSIEALYNVIKLENEDPSYFRVGKDEYCFLSRRCLFALRDIGTKEALEKIKMASKFENTDIKKFVQEIYDSMNER